MKRLFIPFLFIVLAISQTGCVSYKDVQFVSFDKLKVNSISFTGFELSITVTIENPNAYKIKIVDADIDLYIANSNIGKIIVPEKLVLDKKSKKQQTFVVKTGIGKIGKSIIPTIMTLIGKKNVPIKAQGSFKAKAFAIGKKFLVDFDDEIAMEGNLRE